MLDGGERIIIIFFTSKQSLFLTVDKHALTTANAVLVNLTG